MNNQVPARSKCVNRRAGSRWPRKAMALLVVLVLIMMASFIAYGYMFSMENQYRDARMYEEQMQAQHAALSGLELVTALVELSSERRQGIGNLHDNADIFRDCALDSNPASSRSVSVDSWRFSIISPRPINPQSPATGSATASSALELQRDDSLSVLKFGLENQTAKLSLSALASWDRRTPGHAKQVLMSLPGATLEVVEALMERSGIQSPSRKPQSMQSVTANQTRSNDVADPILQLHLLWMGGDLNCNYRLGPFDLAWSQDNSSNSSDRSLGAADLYRSTNHTAGPTSQGPTKSLGSQSRPDENPDNEANYAWRQLLSWEGGFRNENQEGTPRINLNEPNLQKLHQELMQRWPIEWANYVITYRQYGSIVPNPTTSTAKSPSSNAGVPVKPLTSTQPSATPSIVAEASSLGSPNFGVPASRTILTPLELIGAITEVPGGPGSGNSVAGSANSSKRRIKSPFQPDNLVSGNYLGKLLDEVTTQSAPFIVDRVDIREATLPVLMAVPTMDRVTAEAIVQRRQNQNTQRNETSNQNTIAWLLESGVIDLARLVQLEPYLCNQSDVYSCQILGYRDDKSAVYRCTATIDARTKDTKIREFQTWHGWGKGFSVESFAASHQTNSNPNTTRN